MAIKFQKMHGLGNDFVIIDCRESGQMPPRAVMAAMTDRKRGVGCDQLIPILPPQDPRADAFMRIINAPDASEVQACGNATRCVASLLMKEKGVDRVVIQTVAGLLDCRADNAERSVITVDMGVPRTDWSEIPLSGKCDTLLIPFEISTEEKTFSAQGTAVNIGNPHCVFFVDDLEGFPVEKLGTKLEHHELFPEKANIEFARVLDRNRVRMRVWERDTGETMACGSAACATVVAAVRRGLADRKCEIVLNGGSLHFDWRESDGHLFMTGPVAYVFDGTWKSL